MNNNHLKLYNSSITLRLSKKEKSILKKRAFKNKITLSEYIRMLILIDNRKYAIRDNLEKNNKLLNDMMKAKNHIGRDF